LALVPRSVPLKLGKLDTKTDPRWVLAGDLVASQNLRFDAWPKLNKRYGYSQIGAAPAGAQLATYKSQLLLGTGAEAYSFATSGLVDKGVLEALTVSARPVRRDTYVETTPDSAVNPNGITVYTWETNASGVAAQYSVFDTATGQPIVSGVSLGATASKPKPLAIGNYVVILYYDTSSNHLRFIAIPTATPASPTAAADFATDPATSQIFDATVIGGLQGQIVCTYANSGGSNKISLKALTPQLVVGSELIPTTTEVFTTCCTVFADAAQNVWVAYYSGSAVKVFVYDYILTNKLLDFTTLDAAPGTVRNITGLCPGTTATVLYEVTGSQTYNNLIKQVTATLGLNPPVNATFTQGAGTLGASTYFYRVTALTANGETTPSVETSLTIAAAHGVNVNWAAVNNATGYKIYGRSTGAELFIAQVGAGVTTYLDGGSITPAGAMPTVNTTVLLSGPTTLVRSVGLASKPFLYNGRVHVLAAYQSALQSTYFLLAGSTVVAKLAPSVGGGLTAKSILPEVSNPSAGVFTTAYLQTTEIGAQSGLIFSQAGVMAGAFDFTQAQTSVELSDDLHLTGGILWMYDGVGVCEHGFHLYPENVSSAFASTGLTGTYQYVVTYEWMDAQGLIHQSAPSPVLTVNPSNQGVTVTTPTLRLTSKTNVIACVLWRTQANLSVFYRITSISSPVLNSTSADTVAFPNDTASDTSIAGNAQLIFNPDNSSAELPNLSAPAPLHVWRYRNRVALIPAENAFSWVYSKAFVAGVPIEFNAQQLYQSVAQDGGPLTCGIEMDEKNVLFTAKRIYYLVGDGLAANGTGSDYGSSQQNVPSDVGCSNRRSLVLTPRGVIFQAANGKGLYLLGRDLSVSYIGAPVEAYNGLTVTSAQMVPNSRRVVFFTSGGVALAYDYFADKWSVWTNVSAADAAVFNGVLTYLKAGGQIWQETPGSYTDNGAPVLTGWTTSFLSFAGLQGFQRVWRFGILGDYRSPHSLSVSVAFDGNGAPIQVENVSSATALNPGGVSDSTIADTDNPGDGAFPQLEYVVKVARQKCSSIQVSVQESQAGPTYGEGLSISGLTFVVGATGKGLHPVPSSRSI